MPQTIYVGRTMEFVSILHRKYPIFVSIQCVLFRKLFDHTYPEDTAYVQTLPRNKLFCLAFSVEVTKWLIFSNFNSELQLFLNRIIIYLWSEWPVVRNCNT